MSGTRRQKDVSRNAGRRANAGVWLSLDRFLAAFGHGSLFLEEVADAFGNLIHVRNAIGGCPFEHVGSAFADVADLFGDGFKGGLDEFTENFFGQLTGRNAVAVLA